MCDPAHGKLQKELKRHDRLNELEAFLKKDDQFKYRHWWLAHAAEIRRLLAPFDETRKHTQPLTFEGGENGEARPDRRKADRRTGKTWSEGNFMGERREADRRK